MTRRTPENGTISRRAALSLFTASSLELASGVARAAPAPAVSSQGNVLVCVFLRGAADGLNIVVPYTDAAYYRLRPTIAIPPPGKSNGAIDLDGRFGLHPRLAPLEPLFAAGELAFVHAVGSPLATRSHFEAQDAMQTASALERPLARGFLTRYLLEKPAPNPAAIRAVAFAPRVPLALRGYEDALSLQRLDELGAMGDTAYGSTLTDGFAKLYAGGTARATRSGERALSVSERLRTLARGNYAPENNAAYEPQARAFAELARLIKADIGLETAWLDLGGWDTHKQEGNGVRGELPKRLDVLGKALAAFRTDLGPRFERVVVLVMTEFGRTAAENGTGGTDHGHASAMFVLGGPVRGKRVYGDFRGLSPEALYQRRDLAVTTDYRTLLSEILEKHLGLPSAASLFPGFESPSTRLGVI
jgi:uncharacterized protein (DUF1501 family)